MPYFPGEMRLPAEAFDFASLLVVTSWDDTERKPDLLGVMLEGEYAIKLSVKPVNAKGMAEPVTINFALRKKPGRAKTLI